MASFVYCGRLSLAQLDRWQAHCLQCLLSRGQRTVTPWTPRNDCVCTHQAAQWHATRGVLTSLPATYTQIGMRV